MASSTEAFQTLEDAYLTAVASEAPRAPRSPDTRTTPPWPALSVRSSRAIPSKEGRR